MAQIVQLLLLTLAVAIAPSAHSASIYKWTDKKGQIHYTRTPPPKSMTDTKVESQDADKVPAARIEEIPETTPLVKESPKQSPVPLETSHEAEKRQQLCQSAQNRLNEMRRTDKVIESGHEIEITEEERLRRLNELNKIVKENCIPLQQPAQQTQPATLQPAPKAVQKSVPQPQLPLKKRPEQKIVLPPQQPIQ